MDSGLQLYVISLLIAYLALVIISGLYFRSTGKTLLGKRPRKGYASHYTHSLYASNWILLLAAAGLIVSIILLVRTISPSVGQNGHRAWGFVLIVPLLAVLAQLSSYKNRHNGKKKKARKKIKEDNTWRTGF